MQIRRNYVLNLLVEGYADGHTIEIDHTDHELHDVPDEFHRCKGWHYGNIAEKYLQKCEFTTYFKFTTAVTVESGVINHRKMVQSQFFKATRHCRIQKALRHTLNFDFPDYFYQFIVKGQLIMLYLTIINVNKIITFII